MVSITRPTMYAVGVSVVSAVVTVVSGIGFAAWVAEDNRITWPAEEMSRVAVYPANHFLYGDTLAGAFGGSCALLAVSLLALLIALRRAPTPHPLLVAWLAGSLALAAPLSIRYSVILGLPFIASAFVAVILALLRRGPLHDAATERDGARDLKAGVTGR